MNERSVVDVAALLDPDLAAGIAALPIDMSLLDTETLAILRELLVAMPSPEPLAGVAFEDHEIPGRPGVRVRVHRAAGSTGPRPTIYWMHGGGYVIGDFTVDQFRLQQWCLDLDCVCVTVDYRLAPDSPDPIPVEDAYAGLLWTHEHAEVLGIDPARIGVGGESAGGGLAAGLALLARDRGAPDIAFQLLLYPMIDDRFETASSAWADPLWPPEANRFGWDSYLGSPRPDAVSPYAAAARATSVEGLPQTAIIVGGLDGFSDEDIEYAKRLRHAGVPTDLFVYAGAPHGFLGFPSAISRQAAADVNAVLRRFLDD